MKERKKKAFQTPQKNKSSVLALSFFSSPFFFFLCGSATFGMKSCVTGITEDANFTLIYIRCVLIVTDT